MNGSSAAGGGGGQYDGDLPGALDALVAETGTPALAAFVLDSDCAAVEGLTPAGVRWEGCLHPGIAQAYGAPETPWEISRSSRGAPRPV